MDTYEAIFRRKSVRKYKMQAVSPEVLKSIKEYYKQIPGLFPGIETELVIRENLEKPRWGGFLAPKAPYYLAVYSQEAEKYQMNAGCLMEQLSLYMTTRGLGSCYLGGASFFKKNEEYHGKKLVMEMAFGCPNGPLTRAKDQVRRLDLKDLCVLKEPMRSWMRQILEVARMAPSSFNSQPWRFLVSNGKIHIFSKKDETGLKGGYTEFNLGVMLGNIVTAAEALWIGAQLKHLEDISQKEFNRFDYIFSVLLKE